MLGNTNNNYFPKYSEQRLETITNSASDMNIMPEAVC